MTPQNRIKRSPHLKNTLYWYISGLCNLRCSFCTVPTNTKQIRQEVSWTLSNIDKLQRGFMKLPGKWEFFLGGGEPFAFPSFLKIVKIIVSAGHHISVVTNFTSSIENLERFFDIVHNKICLFVASYKPGIHDFENFLKKAERVNSIVQENGGHFSVGTVACKADLEASFQKGKCFLESGIDFALQVEKVNGRYRVYSDEEKEKVVYFGRTFGLDGNNKYTNKICYAGMNYFVLLPGGHIYRCHSAINNPTKMGSYLGNLADGTLRLHETPEKCRYDFCNCVNAHNKNLIVHQRKNNKLKQTQICTN